MSLIFALTVLFFVGVDSHHRRLYVDVFYPSQLAAQRRYLFVISVHDKAYRIYSRRLVGDAHSSDDDVAVIGKKALNLFDPVSSRFEYYSYNSYFLHIFSFSATCAAVLNTLLF